MKFVSSGDCRSKDINLHDRDLLEIVFSAAIGDHLAIVDSILKQTKKFSGYNQDCVNIILRLVNQRKEDAAFKVFSSMKPAVSTDRQGQASGGFFIRQLVRANCAPEKIVAMCRNLVDSGLNNRAFFRALETANALGKSQIANVILKEIPKQKDSLRPQAFWPLLVTLLIISISNLVRRKNNSLNFFIRPLNPKPAVRKEYWIPFVKWQQYK